MMKDASQIVLIALGLYTTSLSRTPKSPLNIRGNLIELGVTNQREGYRKSSIQIFVKVNMYGNSQSNE